MTAPIRTSLDQATADRVRDPTDLHRELDRPQDPPVRRHDGRVTAVTAYCNGGSVTTCEPVKRPKHQ